MKYLIEENCLTIFLPREVDHHQAEEIRKTADSMIEKHHIKYVIFDFSQTEFMDSSGIGIIAGRYKKVICFEGKVYAINVDRHIKRILYMSGLDKMIEIVSKENK